MGFMAGFGSAFADSFNQQQKASTELKSDKIKMDYEYALSRRKTLDEIDRTNASALKVAQRIVEMTHQPPETLGTIYDLTRNGNEEQAWKWARENTASVVKPGGDTAIPGDTSGPADPKSDLTSGAQSSVNAQMSASKMGAPAPDTGLFGKTPEAISGGAAPTPTPDPRDTTGNATPRPSASVGPTATPTVGNNQQPDAATQNQQPKPQEPAVTGQPVVGEPNGGNITWAPRDTTTWASLRVQANNPNDALALNEWAKIHGTPAQKAEAQHLLTVYDNAKNDTITRQAIATGQGYRIQRAFIRDGKGGYTGETAYPDYSQDDIHPTWKDKNGNELPPEMVEPVGRDQEADMKSVSQEGSEALKPYQQAKQDAKDFIRTSHDYIKLLKDNNGKYDGKAMDISGNVSQFIDRYRRAGINIIDLVAPKGNIEDTSTAIGELDAAKSKIENELASGRFIEENSRNAMKASLIDIQGTKLAYQMAAQANGSTKGVSNQDFQHYKDIVSGGGNPQTAAKALQMSVQQAVKSIAGMEGDIKKGKGSASYYAGRYNNAPNGFDMGTGFDQESQSDPEISKALKEINSDASIEDNPGQQVNTDPDTPDWAKGATKPIIGLDGNEVPKNIWRHLPPALQEAIKAKNGL